MHRTRLSLALSDVVNLSLVLTLLFSYRILYASCDTAIVRTSHDRTLATIEYEGNIYEYFLTSKANLVDTRGFHYVIRNESQYKIQTDIDDRQCMFEGIPITHNDTQLALYGCGESFYGLLILESGELVLIKPNYDEDSHSNEVHLVQKREALINQRGQLLADDSEKQCLFDASKDPYAKLPVLTQNQEHSQFMASLRGPLTVELAIFADQELWKKFKKQFEDKAERELQNFVLAILNNINMIYNQKSIEPKIIFKLIRYEIWKTSPESLRGPAHKNGDVDLFLTNFCEYQKSLNPSSDADARHWDHAVMLTGYNLHRGKLVMAAGYAPVKGMCTDDYSCTLAEGNDFGAVYTIAHEIGHSLGMLHDGQNNRCSAQCCIMSYISGGGKTSWSSCSVQEMNSFLSQLGNSAAYPDNCLTDGEDAKPQLDDSGNKGQLPGQRYTANMQCKIAHGDCNKMELREGYELNTICDMLYCGDGDGYIRSSEPALDGTYCGNKKWCFDGKCIKWPGLIQPSPVNGGWTQWNDAPPKECGGGECSTCEIKGQIRVRRSVRLCENPSPDNDGKDCQGSSFRGVVCDQQPCKGVSADQYATTDCTKLKTTKTISTKISLTGKGVQQKDDPCKIWCQTSENHNFYWTLDSFPDGTKCGDNSYCMKGECMKLGCNAKNLILNTNDCPNKKGEADNVAPFASSWMTWSSWSSCSRTCGKGTRNRLRQCKGKLCIGVTYDSEPCETKICETSTVVKSSTSKISSSGQSSPHVDSKPSIPTRQNTQPRKVESWSTWSQCSKTCGGSGKQTRRTICSGCQSKNETRPCNSLPCRS